MKKLLKNIETETNNINLDISDIIEIAATPKRQRVFYLLNKLVGNHIEVEPNKIRAVGHIMANLVYPNNFNIDVLANYIKNGKENSNVIKELDKFISTEEKVFVIGLAKSATAIGMATADSIKDSYYISTIRETPIKGKHLFDFEENHTLLTKHRCYLEDTNKLKNADRIIIVEDEITTGKTMINLINKLIMLSKAKIINIVTILNFSDSSFLSELEKIEKEYNIKIKINEILKGKLNYNQLNNDILKFIKNNFNNNADEIKLTTKVKTINKFKKAFVDLENGKKLEMMEKSGCFGISFDEIKSIEEKSKEIAKEINNKHKNVLVISHGENMYIPSRIAYYISRQSKFKSTTQNTILAKGIKDYAINQISKFKVNDIEYFLYNKEKIEEEYDIVYFIVDSDINIKLTNNTKIIKI